MNFSFIQISSQEIAKNQQAIIYLEMGAAGFGGMLSVHQTIENAAEDKDLFILILYATKLVGAIHLTVTQQETGRVLTSVLLGGIEFEQWAEDLRQFYYKLAKDHNCDEFMLMGRRGFKRYFPELQEVATVFRVRLT